MVGSTPTAASTVAGCRGPEMPERVAGPGRAGAAGRAATLLPPYNLAKE